MEAPEPQTNEPTPAPGVEADVVDLSVVAPAHNEEENVEPLVTEIRDVLAKTGVTFEILLVDDGSTDATRSRATELMRSIPGLRCVATTGTPRGSGNGQSAALYVGFRAARGRLLGQLDADLQNDPSAFADMITLMRESASDRDRWIDTMTIDFVQGDRSHARKDGIVRRYGSIVGRLFRRLLLGDTIRDTGCSLRIMRREIGLAVPLQYKGMHRFIPVYGRALGYNVVETRVNHRPRIAGETKYGAGITKRAIPGLIDCFAVRWMRKRVRPVTSKKVVRATSAARDDGSSAQAGRTQGRGMIESKPSGEPAATS